jgi:hypothetical protein
MSSMSKISLQPQVRTMLLRCWYIMLMVSSFSTCLLGFADYGIGDGFLANSTLILPALKKPYKG